MKAGFFARLALAAAVAAVASHARAEWPDHPIKAVVPFAPGSSNDTVGRIISPYLSKALGQPIVIENKAGAGGNIGIAAVAKSAPDGYTILFCASGMTLNPAVYRNLPYDPIREITAIAEIATGPYVVVVNPKVPANTLTDLVDYARKNPGKLNGAAGGLGTQLSIEFFKIKTGTRIEVIPYSGTGLAATSVLSGETDMAIMDSSSIGAQVNGGQLRALAVAGERRVTNLPNVPTTKEAGLGEYTAGTFFGVFAAGNTPKAIVDRINAEVVKIVETPEVKQKLQALGLEPSNRTPDDFTARYHSELSLWKDLVIQAKIPLVD